MDKPWGFRKAPQFSMRCDIAPADAALLGIGQGEHVCVKSRYGEARLAVRLSAAMKEGELFTTFHRPELFVNRLTSPVRDRLVQAPEYKVTAVRLKADPAT